MKKFQSKESPAGIASYPNSDATRESSPRHTEATLSVLIITAVLETRESHMRLHAARGEANVCPSILCVLPDMLLSAQILLFIFAKHSKKITKPRQIACGSLVHLMFDEANHLVVDALKIPITQQQVDIPVLLERHLPFCHTLNCSPYTVEICSRCNQEQTIEKSQVYPKEKCVATVDINLARSSVTCYEQSTVSRWISCSNSISKIDLAIHLHYTSSLL